MLHLRKKAEIQILSGDACDDISDDQLEDRFPGVDLGISGMNQRENPLITYIVGKLKGHPEWGGGEEYTKNT